MTDDQLLFGPRVYLVLLFFDFTGRLVDTFFNYSYISSHTHSPVNIIMAELSPDDSPAADELSITISHHGKTHTFTFSNPEATLTDLTQQISERFSIPAEHQKFMISPKVGLLKPPYPDPNLPLHTIASKRIQLLAPLPSDLASLAPPPTRPKSTLKTAKPARTIDHRKAHNDITYTFHKLIPLNYLPNPERSLRFLERLRDDAGIKSAMAKHKFAVGILTEMNPAEHTTHESKTLGLNRNHGEVIELRLRTDSYDGYRDYKTIRHTLCHELAHNVHGDHDRKFWDLMKIIEADVKKGDWTRGGQTVGHEEFYNPDDQGAGDHIDGGGWQGGDFVLGGSSASASSGLSRREAMAKAAEERMRKQKELEDEPSQ